ncbi:MAG: pullulanase-type alpha-1,6-glucosidase [Telluria sp.]
MDRKSSITSRFAWCWLLAASALLTACGAGSDSARTSSTQQQARTAAQVASVAPVAPANIRIHFRHLSSDVTQYGVYSWDGPLNPSHAWITDRFMFTQKDGFGGYVDIPVDTSKNGIWFLVTDGYGNKNCGYDQNAPFTSDIATKGQEIWLIEGECDIHTTQPVISFGNLANASAHWLTADTLAWPNAPQSGSYKLFYAANGGLGSDPSGVTGADGSIDLTISGTLSDALKQKYPHLANSTALTMSATDAAKVASLATSQFALAQFDAQGNIVMVTSLQMSGMLDSVFAPAASNAALGVSFARGVPTFRLWAPTAKSVALNIYPDANAAATTTVAMSKDAASGVWSYTAPDAGWTNKAYYTYTVNVLSRWADNKVVSNTVTDPYSVSLNANSARSFVADLDSGALKPTNWDHHPIPRLDQPTDIAIYELHIRDFSAQDSTVPETHRGKYLAFTDINSNGMRHLEGLARAGLTHVHLLPSFDFASVNEAGCTTPNVPNSGSDWADQQAAVAAAQDTDCFNWGYDPVHYNAPEGSYSTNANDGAVRIREFRSMVQSLHENGLRVAMDVVYNHTSSSQQWNLSVLDKIVPAYYYRLNANGGITNDSCCADTASENAMFAKLMIDSVSLWAREYKVDSFRFDIMGFTPLAVMKQLQQSVNAAAGRPIYLYGEAWNFGTVGNDARFVQARQANMFGTGIGSFNDRLRDAVRGGGCCDSGDNLVSQQGFINGFWYDKNPQGWWQSKDDLLRLADLVRVGLSGTLRDYHFTDRFGNERANSQIDYFGQNAGFTANPAETINYIEAHDNQTLFDINAFRLPQDTPLADRVRVQNLGAAIVTLAQGIPFIHAGQDILRSKSLDRDSYNAGDWFNAIDWSYQTNKFGIGLPMANVNQSNWSIMAPILRNTLIKPDTNAILTAKAYMQDMLTIRAESSLFRMRTADDIKQRLKFFNVGPDQVPGVIVMALDGHGYDGAKYKRAVVVVNVDKVAKSVAVPQAAGWKLDLHKIQRKSTADALVGSSRFDRATGTFSVPPRTTAVFVQEAE